MGKYDITKEDLVGDEYRKQYLEHYILSKYKEEIKRNKLGMCQFYYSYITFSINALKNQTMSFREILKLRYSKYEKATTRQKQMIQYFFDLASDEFELEAQQIQSVNEAKIIDVIQFDESLDECSQEYRSCLNQKYEFLQTISSDYINLKQLEKQASSLQKKRQVLQEELIKLFHKNSSSVQLQNICEGFEECLIIEPIFSKKYEKLRKSGYSHKNRIPLYIENSAAVYISLLIDIGKIVKVSKNFRDVVPLVDSNAEALGKNINFMQPTEIAQVHEQILVSSLERKTLNQNIKHYPIIIAKDSQGWSIPYNVKIQLCMIGNTELGACGWLKQIKDGNMYIMTSSVKDGFKVFTMDQNFYSVIFKSYLSIQEARKIKLNSIIPMLTTLLEKGQPGQSYETIIIQPFSVNDTVIVRDIYDEKFIGQLMKSNIYQMKFSFFPVDNPFVQFVEFQITSVRPLNDQFTKREALRNYKMQIYEYMDISRLKLNYAETLNSMNIIQDISREQIGTAQNLAIPNLKRLSIENFKSKQDDELEEDSTHLNSIDSQNHIEMRVFKGDSATDLQSQQKKLNSLRLIMEASNENSVHGNAPALASRREYNKKPSLELAELPVSKVEEIRVKQIQIDSGIRQSNTTLMNLGCETQNTIHTPSHQSRKQFGSINQYDNINPPTTTDTHNILSSDSLFLSPLSSNRRPLLQPDSTRATQLKGDALQLNSPILENSFEDDNASKYVPKSLTQTIKSKNTKQKQPKRKKNVSIQENLEIFNMVEKTELNQSHSHSQNTSKNGDKKTQDDHKGFQDGEKDGSVKTGKTQRSTAKQILKIFQNHIYKISKTFFQIKEHK